jgi:hypothetical protein
VCNKDFSRTLRLGTLSEGPLCLPLPKRLGGGALARALMLAASIAAHIAN